MVPDPRAVRACSASPPVAGQAAAQQHHSALTRLLFASRGCLKNRISVTRGYPSTFVPIPDTEGKHGADSFLSVMNYINEQY